MGFRKRAKRGLISMVFPKFVYIGLRKNAARRAARKIRVLFVYMAKSKIKTLQSNRSKMAKNDTVNSTIRKILKSCY